MCEFCPVDGGPCCVCEARGYRRGPRVLSLLGDVALFGLAAGLAAGLAFGAYLIGTALRVSP